MHSTLLHWLIHGRSSSVRSYHHLLRAVCSTRRPPTKFAAATGHCQQRRAISSRIYDQLTFKGLLCSSFPDNVDVNQLLSRKATIYAGFDPTAASLHLGNLLVLVSLLHLLHHGHRVIVLIGDATAQIGDPSGKTTERPPIEVDLVRQNADGIEADVRRVLANYQRHFASHRIPEENVIITRNGTWYDRLTAIELLSHYGRHLRMGHLLSKSSVRERLDSPQGLSFGEFSYQLLQAYDWLHLFRQYGCRFQLGGLDQTLNIANGHDLIKKCLADNQTYGLFAPLLTDESGRKIGKSDGGEKAIYLNARMSSPFSMYQYLMRRPDAEVGRLLRMFNLKMGDREVETILGQQLQSPKPWRLQRLLAAQLTTLVHGEEGLAAATRITQAFFSRDPSLLGSLSPEELAEVFAGAEEHFVEFIPGHLTVLQLALKTACFDSPLAAVNAIQEGGFYLNYRRVVSPSMVLTEEGHILPNKISIVSVGKKSHRLVRWL